MHVPVWKTCSKNCTNSLCYFICLHHCFTYVLSELLQIFGIRIIFVKIVNNKICHCCKFAQSSSTRRQLLMITINSQIISSPLQPIFLYFDNQLNLNFSINLKYELLVYSTNKSILSFNCSFHLSYYMEK